MTIQKSNLIRDRLENFRNFNHSASIFKQYLTSYLDKEATGKQHADTLHHDRHEGADRVHVDGEKFGEDEKVYRADTDIR